jgi:sterol desaturase/sphingolipid hydroxylase (fatty acid hydroxylase superfamily)
MSEQESGLGIFAGLAELARLARLDELASGCLQAAGLIAGFFVVIYFFERRSGADGSRYLTRSFLNDILYTLFYRAGFYNIFIYAAFANLLGPRLDPLRIDLLASLPPLASGIAYWITVDFIGYWIHRLQHRSRFLWAFHSIHHAQERMTYLTSFRIHPGEQIIANLIMFVPLLVLGVPTRFWIPLYVAQLGFELVQHAELPWRYGRLYPLLVSPVFHSLHHSPERRYHDMNYGKILSVWDHLFGTALKNVPRPIRTGVEGMQVPETLAGQLLAPIRALREPGGARRS